MQTIIWWIFSYNLKWDEMSQLDLLSNKLIRNVRMEFNLSRKAVLKLLHIPSMQFSMPVGFTHYISTYSRYLWKVSIISSKMMFLLRFWLLWKIFSFCTKYTGSTISTKWNKKFKTFRYRHPQKLSLGYSFLKFKGFMHFAFQFTFSQRHMDDISSNASSFNCHWYLYELRKSSSKIYVN